MHHASESRRKPDGTIHYAKVPYYIDGDRRRGDLGNDGGRLVTYAEAVAALELWGDTRAGLGFALGPDGRGGCWQGIDLDKVPQRPDLEPLITQLPGYVEVSPSGNGYHAIGYGAPFATLGSNASGIEAYSEGRFFTFTGWAVRQGPLADLGPFVSLVLAPRHAAHRKVREVPPTAPTAPTGEREIDELSDALRYLDADDRDTWIRVGQALHTLGPRGFNLFSDWSATSQRFPGGDDVEGRWETFSGTRTSWQSVFNQAAANGWKNPRKRARSAASVFAGSVAVPGGLAANAPALGPMPMPPGVVPPVPAVPAPRLGDEPLRVGEPLDASNPLRTARHLIAAHYTHEGLATLLCQNGQFLHWLGSAYAMQVGEDVRAVIYRFLERQRDHRGEPFKATQTRVSQTFDALKGAANLPAAMSAPTWIDGRRTPEPQMIVACQNGLLHLPTRVLHPATPAFFSLNAVPFDYDATAPNPEHWLKFLAQIWPDDPLAIDALQEVFGYLLTPDTTQQKIFLIVGPKRSGKGTIARILTALLGQANVAGPTLGSLSQPFGLQPLIGKLAAIVSDARLGSRADQHAIAERLLAISGEDSISVPVKHLSDWTGRLSTRFVVLTNELPRIADSSGALASRFVILSMSTSFLGREDPGLTARLLGDLPGILGWAIEGYHKLNARGYFIEPPSSADAARELADLSSPISAFVREVCEVDAAGEVECGQLFRVWCAWSLDQGRQHPGSQGSFGRDLRAAVTGVSVANLRQGDTRARFYRGLRLQSGTRWNAYLSIAGNFGK